MMKIWRWIRAYWYIPFFIILTILGWILFQRKGTPFKQTVTELKAIRAGQQVLQAAERDGAGKARIEVLARYARKKDDLTAKQQMEARRLQSDPIALAKFLVRAGTE